MVYYYDDDMFWHTIYFELLLSGLMLLGLLIFHCLSFRKPENNTDG